MGASPIIQKWVLHLYRYSSYKGGWLLHESGALNQHMAFDSESEANESMDLIYRVNISPESYPSGTYKAQVEAGVFSSGKWIPNFEAASLKFKIRHSVEYSDE